MKLTVDANVLFAALIRDSMARRVLFHSSVTLNAPYFALTELRKYRGAIFSKSHLSEGEFQTLLEKALKRLDLVQLGALYPYLKPASLLAEDPKDLLYVATALFSGSVILSNDRSLKKQKRVRVYSVDELAKELGI